MIAYLYSYLSRGTNNSMFCSTNPTINNIISTIIILLYLLVHKRILNYYIYNMNMYRYL